MIILQREPRVCGLYGTFRRLLARVNVQGLQRITQVVRCAPTFDSLAQLISCTSELGEILEFVGFSFVLAACLDQLSLHRGGNLAMTSLDTPSHAVRPSSMASKMCGWYPCANPNVPAFIFCSFACRRSSLASAMVSTRI